MMATVVPVSTASARTVPPPDTTALILGGTTCPTPDDILSTPSRTSSSHRLIRASIEYVAVTTPQELWPVTGVFRLLGLALGPPELAGLAAQRGRTSRCGNSPGSST